MPQSAPFNAAAVERHLRRRWFGHLLAATTWSSASASLVALHFLGGRAGLLLHEQLALGVAALSIPTLLTTARIGRTTEVVRASLDLLDHESVLQRHRNDLAAFLVVIVIAVGGSALLGQPRMVLVLATGAWLAMPLLARPWSITPLASATGWTLRLLGLGIGLAALVAAVFGWPRIGLALGLWVGAVAIVLRHLITTAAHYLLARDVDHTWKVLEKGLAGGIARLSLAECAAACGALDRSRAVLAESPAVGPGRAQQAARWIHLQELLADLDARPALTQLFEGTAHLPHGALALAEAHLRRREPATELLRHAIARCRGSVTDAYLADYAEANLCWSLALEGRFDEAQAQLDASDPADLPPARRHRVERRREHARRLMAGLEPLPLNAANGVWV